MPYYYIPPNQITGNLFTLYCNDYTCILDTELLFLEDLTFNQLLKICSKVKVLARRRNTKSEMISEIQDKIIFEIPEEGDFIQNL